MDCFVFPSIVSTLIYSIVFYFAGFVETFSHNMLFQSSITLLNTFNKSIDDLYPNINLFYGAVHHRTFEIISFTHAVNMNNDTDTYIV